GHANPAVPVRREDAARPAGWYVGDGQKGLTVTHVEHVTGGSGVRLALRASGPATGPAVLFLHGWAQSGAVWRTQLDGPLHRDFRLFAADLRGHGDSEVPDDEPDPGYDSADWAADVRAMIGHIGGPVVLVGWSYGGLVVTDYLREFG